MSDDDLWLIVEGRDHDRPHYERLLNALPSTKHRKASIRLAEEIELGGVSAGGKTHVLALHDHLETAGKLTSHNRTGQSSIVFMVDRDRDDYLGTLRTSRHVLYTFGSDVEADILLHADIWTALRDAYGIDSQLSEQVRRFAPSPADELLLLWKDWLSISLTAITCGASNCAPWASPSLINRNTFDQVDTAKAAEVGAKIRAIVDVAAYDLAYAKATQHVELNGTRLLKGRWIARYIKYLVETHLKSEIVRVSVPPNAVIDTALASVPYDAAWATEYDARFADLVPTPVRESVAVK